MIFIPLTIKDKNQIVTVNAAQVSVFTPLDRGTDIIVGSTRIEVEENIDKIKELINCAIGNFGASMLDACDSKIKELSTEAKED